MTKPTNKPFAHEFMAQPWAMEQRRLEAMLTRLSELPTDSPTASNSSEPKNYGDPDYQVVDGVAIVPIKGIILSDVPVWIEWLGAVVTSTETIQANIEAAVDDSSVKAIMLDVNSPGGTVSGVDQAAQYIFAARNIKPVHAAITDLGDSAAYWIASQAHTISAELTASAGSIGVYVAIDDWSKAYDEFGVRAIVIKSGPYKGTGVPGTVITDEQLIPIQEEVDGLAEIFIDAVSRGRGATKSEIETLATGRDWLATQALGNGLIDTVETAESAFYKLAQEG